MQGLAAPLINAGSEARLVSIGLHAIAERAWNISARMLRSRLTFNFIFPDAATRFSASSMTAVYCDRDPAELQTGHWRVRLVVSPVVTARNNTGASLSVFALMPAEVIPMK